MKREFLMDLYKTYVAGVSFLSSRWPIGTNVYERDWDALLLLDTCRIDGLREVAPEYEFLSDIESITSIGSTSSEFMAQTFVEEYTDEIRNTAYLSANAWSEKIFEEGQTPEDHYNLPLSLGKWRTVDKEIFGLLEHVWKYQPIDERSRPEVATKRAIQVGREISPDRLIIHYQVPHSPYRVDAFQEDRGFHPWEKEPMEYLKNGGDFEKVWRAYLNDLRYVLDSVDVLLENLDANKVVISADHGEAFGEYRIYGHGMALPHPHVKRVPWAKTTATDTGDVKPNLDTTEQQSTAEEQLGALGYLD